MLVEIPSTLQRFGCSDEVTRKVVVSSHPNLSGYNDLVAAYKTAFPGMGYKDAIEKQQHYGMIGKNNLV